MKFSLFASSLSLAACLAAATPKGDYVLIDQGVAANRAFAVLGMLTLDGAGNITGTEVFRSTGISMSADVAGTYTMSSANSGTLVLSTSDSDSDEDASPMVQNYRFLVTSSGELQAIRTDNGVFSLSSLLPAQTASSAAGSVSFNEVDGNASLLAQVALDGNGALAGSATTMTAAGGTTATVSGSYAMVAKGLGTLTVNLITKDDEGNDQTSTQTYRMAATSEGIKAIRTDPGVVSVANLEVQ